MNIAPTFDNTIDSQTCISKINTQPRIGSTLFYFISPQYQVRNDKCTSWLLFKKGFKLLELVCLPKIWIISELNGSHFPSSGRDTIGYLSGEEMLNKNPTTKCQSKFRLAKFCQIKVSFRYPLCQYWCYEFQCRIQFLVCQNPFRTSTQPSSFGQRSPNPDPWCNSLASIEHVLLQSISYSSNRHRNLCFISFFMLGSHCHWLLCGQPLHFLCVIDHIIWICCICAE